MTIHRTIGSIALIAVSLLAAASLCHASMPMDAMHPCPLADTGSAVCPLASQSEDAVTGPVSAVKTISYLIAVVILITGALGVHIGGRRLDRLIAYVRRLRREPAALPLTNPLIALISDGVLHARVFAV